MRDWQATVRASLSAARLDPAREFEIVEELAQHLEDRYRAARAAGADDGEAERAVLAELSDPEGLARALEMSAGPVRQASAGSAAGVRPALGDLGRDLRHAARTLRRSPWFAATAVLCLGLGIGATSTVFGVVDALFLRPPPGLGQPGRLVRPYLTLQSDSLGISGRAAALPYGLYAEIRGRARSIDGIAGFTNRAVSVGLGPDARQADASLVTGDYFSVLFLEPALGRLFGLGEPSPVAVVSQAYWRNELGADPAAIGSAIRLNGHVFTIVGVAPQRFHGVDFGAPAIWIPVSQWAELGLSAAPLALTPIARLAAGVTPAAAQTELGPLMLRALRADYGTNTEARLELGSLMAARGPYPSQQALVTRWLAIAAAFVLAIACANTANLLLARAVVRSKEIAIRLSMGASRARLLRQLLTESALLACCGAALGLLLAHWGLALVPLGRLPPLSVFTDIRVLTFAIAVAVLCTAAFGTAPALMATGGGFRGVLNSSRRGTADARSRIRGALMVAQVALGTLLLVGAGLFVHSLRNLQTIDAGIDLDNLLLASVDLRSAGYDEDAAARFYEGAVERLRRVPGVRGATIASNPPLSGYYRTRFYFVPDSIAGDAAPPPSDLIRSRQRGAVAFAAGVGPRYFATVGTPVLEGRDFDERDRQDSTPVVIVNRAFAERDWPGKSALGRCVDVLLDFSDAGSAKCYRVVGVAADAKYEGLEEPRRAAFFLPASQDPVQNAPRSLLIRTDARPVGIVHGIRAALATLVPYLPFVDVRPLTEQLRRTLEAPRLGASLFSAFGTLALVLAAIGLYGVVAVPRRRRAVCIGRGAGQLRPRAPGRRARSGGDPAQRMKPARRLDPVPFRRVTPSPQAA